MSEKHEIVLNALRSLRVPAVYEESELHARVARLLSEAALDFTHEARLAPGRRIDFLCEGVGIELKKQKPPRKSLLSQCARYLESPLVESLIVALPTGADLPAEIGGKRVTTLQLSRLWGPALPKEAQKSEEAAPAPALAVEPLSEKTVPEPPPIPPDAEYPAYLASPAGFSHLYGTLSYNRRSDCWTIKGEPCVTELAKRLFPGCDGRGRGVARFTAHRRIVGELNWLMLRYPLEIKPSDKARWDAAWRALPRIGGSSAI